MTKKHPFSRLSTVTSMRLLLTVIAGALLAACASMGRPEGGPVDVDPPVFVKSNPAPSQLNVKGNKIEIIFNENVQIENPSEKVVVSPAQQIQPVITALGRKVTVELRDTLIPSTTYTIDFSDAISDLNEKNLLDGFAIDFSTGDNLDSLRISGMVLQASNLEPAQGMLVGAYSNLADSAISTLRFERITKTNQLGQFTIRNLKPGTYRVFAVNDLNRDFHWDRSEDIAFYDTTITPTAEVIQVADTLRGADGSDSIVMMNATRFMPNDILLTWFNEDYHAQYLADNKRPERNRIEIRLGAPTDTLPTFIPVNGPRAGVDLRKLAVLEASPTLDTLSYWLTDSAVILQDSLLLQATYQRVDSLDRLEWTTDTLRLFMRPSKTKKKEQKKEDGDSVPAIEFLKLKIDGGATRDLYRDIVITSELPLASVDTSAISLQMLVDTVWTRVDPPALLPSPQFSNKKMTLRAPWKEGEKYRLLIDSASVTDIYGRFNRPVKADFTIKKKDEYSTLIFNINGLDSHPAIVELLNGDNMVKTAPVVDGRATFNYVDPGTYYARLYLDDNNNGRFDDGSYSERRQPEEVYYYNKKITLKQNFTARQTWNIYELPLDMQKPLEIKKNKPKLRPDELNRNKADEEEEDEYDQYTDPYLQYGFPR